MRSAPRYDARLFRALRELDDPSQPMAETCRRVGDEAERLGLKRPSYVHTRRILKRQRESGDARRRHREAVRLIALDVADDLLRGRPPNTYEIAERLVEARARLALQERL